MTNEGFQNLVLEKLGDLKQDVSGVKEDVSGLKEEVSGLKEEVSGLKQDVSGLKEDVFDLKQDVSGLKEEVSGLKQDVSGLKEGFKTLEEQQQRLESKMDAGFQQLASMVDLLGKKQDKQSDLLQVMILRMTEQEASIYALKSARLAEQYNIPVKSKI